MSTLAGKVAVVTGSGRGIGEATAIALAREGARVVVVDVDEGEARRVAEALPVEAIAVGADVSSEEGVRRWSEATTEAFGGYDLLHNNAGIEGRIGALEDLSTSDFDRVIAVNLRSVFLGLRESLRHFTEREVAGSVVNTASEAGLKGVTGLGPYVASKHGVIGLSCTAALEGAARGIRVNAIAPGQVQTQMMRALESSLGDPDDVHSGIAEAIPLGRYSDPGEIAELVVWLFGPQASFVTGAVYSIDGGNTAGAVLPLPTETTGG